MSNENSPVARAVPFSTTVQVRDGCLCLHVQRAARVLARRFDEALKPAGLTNGQFSLLMSLNRPAAAPRAAMNGKFNTASVVMRDVAALLGMDRTTLTAAVKTLERRGLLRVVIEPEDRRTRLLELTAMGLSALAAAVPIWTREHALLDREFDAKGSSVAGLLRDLRSCAG